MGWKRYDSGFAHHAAESRYPELWAGLVGAWVPVLDITGLMLRGVNPAIYRGIISGTVATLTRNGYYNNGTNAGGKCTILSPGKILSGLSAFTIFSSFSTKAQATIGATPESYIGSGGNALYCERPPTGNDIVKLVLVKTSGGEAANNLAVEFTYRDTAGSLFQRRMNALTANDGNIHSACCTKNGSAHLVFFDGLLGPNTSAYGGTATLTSTTTQCLMGNDAADNNSAWNGYIQSVLLYSRQLTPKMVHVLHIDPLAPFCPRRRLWAVPSATVARWPWQQRRQRRMRGAR